MLSLLLGCWVYKKSPDLQVHPGGQDLQHVEGRVGLAPTVFMADLNGERDDFRDGVYVGNVVMTGGYVVENTGEAGLQTIAKNYELNSIEAYRSTVSDWVDTAFAAVLDERKVSWKPVDLSVQVPVKHLTRGSHPLDGTDNVNIPRFTLDPAPLGAAVGGVDLVVVPLVVAYYSHNAGWFVGQEHGCGAGARFRLLWTAYDATTGVALEWGDVDRRTIEPYTFQPNSSQLEDMLIAVEHGVAKELRREFLR